VEDENAQIRAKHGRLGGSSAAMAQSLGQEISEEKCVLKRATDKNCELRAKLDS